LILSIVLRAGQSRKRKKGGNQQKRSIHEREYISTRGTLTRVICPKKKPAARECVKNPGMHSAGGPTSPRSGCLFE
jgi:hypothetical protein